MSDINSENDTSFGKKQIMKRTKYYIATAVYFILCAFAVIFAEIKLSQKTENNRVAFMNRMTKQIYETGSTDVSSFFSDFKKEDIPSEIHVYYSDTGSSLPMYFGNGNNTYIWTLKDPEGNVTGFVEYGFDPLSVSKIILPVIMSVILFAIPLVLYFIYVDRSILRPFREFSEYPEKLSRGLTMDGVPETKNRMFGKYVWGMNMLNDKLDSDRKEIDRLLYDRKKFISTLAHGIKTPVANIKLYSEAIETGLYRGGNPDSKDSEIARKISRNADEIAELVSGILNDPGALKNSISVKVEDFYLEDVRKRITEEFENRLKVACIPFEAEISGNPLVRSDIALITRCLTQLMENAIKYGDGTGIKIRLYRQDDITFFSVTNNGATLGDGEIPYVFNCYFRGSNAAGKEGSGIGLYEAKSVAKALGGDMMMKGHEKTTEVIMYVPDAG